MIKRDIVFIILLSFLFPLLFSCSSSSENKSSGGIQHIYEDSSTDNAVKVSGIKIASNYIELVKEAGVDLQYNISAVVQPENAENKVLHYTSSNPEIAEVSSDGIVAIKDFGSFNVTIQSEARQDIRQQVDFYVRENILTKIDVENNPLSFFGAYSIFQYGVDKEPDTNIGGSLSINMDRNEENPVEVKLLFNGLDMPVSINMDNFSDISYEEASVSLFSYLQGAVKGDDKAIVKLKADENSSLIDNGIVKSGQTLYLSLKKEYDLVPGQASHVQDMHVSVTEIQVNDVHKLDRRTSTAYTLKPTVLPVNASNKAVTYSTSNSKVAKVSPTGVVTALNEGSANIIVKSVSNDEVIGTTAFTIVDSTVRVKDIVFENIDKNVYIGSPVTVKATALPDNATYKDITYYSKNPSIATVN
ncbi:MAG: Ig-like domain-containing protein, partial [Candidatus Mucispirillum faecigallinarum]|nr:Ig-like domain-containing protein [Candidatus Mucispirillum faecigallinarum]